MTADFSKTFLPPVLSEQSAKLNKMQITANYSVLENISFHYVPPRRTVATVCRLVNAWFNVYDAVSSKNYMDNVFCTGKIKYKHRLPSHYNFFSDFFTMNPAQSALLEVSDLCPVAIRKIYSQAAGLHKRTKSLVTTLQMYTSLNL